MKYLVIAFLTLVLHVSCQSQNKTEDILDNIDGWDDIVRDLYIANDFDSLKVLAEKMIEIDSTYWKAYFSSGIYWELRKNYDSALYYFKTVDAIEPSEDFSLDLKIAELYGKLGQDSLEYIQINIAMQKELYLDEVTIGSWVYIGKISTTDTLILDDSRENLALKMRKDWFWEHQLYDSAIKDMTAIVEFEPYGDYLYEKGMMHYFLQDYNTALIEFDNALDGWMYYITDTASLLIHQASSLAKVGKTDLAFRLYNKTVVEYGEIALLYYLRGESYFDIGKKDSGCDDWVKAISLGLTIDSFNSKCK